LITYIFDRTIEIDTTVFSMVICFVIMCITYIIAPKIRKIAGHD